MTKLNFADEFALMFFSLFGFMFGIAGIVRSILEDNEIFCIISFWLFLFSLWFWIIFISDNVRNRNRGGGENDKSL